MPYDKENIKKVSDNKLFDDHFDPLALSIPEQEKERIAGGLDQAAKDIEKRLEESPKKRASRGKGRSKHRQGKPGFLTRLMIFFVKLFTGVDDKEYQKRQKFKELRKKLRQIKPPIYNFRTNAVSSNLAKQLFSLWNVISPYQSSFDAIFSAKSSASRIEFQLFFLGVVLDSQQLSMVDDFSDEYMDTLVKEERESSVRRIVEDKLHLFLSMFEEDDKRLIDRIFSEMMNFNDLLCFDFSQFFKRFNPNFTFEHGRPVFRDCRPEGLINLLKDLEIMLLLVQVKYLPHVLNAGKGYYEANLMNGQEPEQDKIRQMAMQRLYEEGYRSLIGAIGTLLNDHQLGLLIAFLEKNPQYEAHIYPRRTNFFSEFVKNLQSTVVERMESAIRRKKMNEVVEKVHALFGDGEIHNKYLYSEEKNRLLRQFDLPLFLYTEPFLLSLHFYSMKYYVYHKRTFNKLLVDGSFKNSLTRRMLSDEFYKMDELYNEFIEFGETVNEKSDKGAKFGSMLRSFKGDLPSKKAISTRISIINQQIFSVLKKYKATMQNLQIVTRHIRQDLNARQTETVANLKKIGGSGNANFINDFKNTCHDVEVFNEILSRVFDDNP